MITSGRNHRAELFDPWRLCRGGSVVERHAVGRSYRRCRLRGLHREVPDRRPEGPGRPQAPPGHQLDTVREALRRVRSRCDAPAFGVRLLQQRRFTRLHRAHPAHEAGRRARPLGAEHGRPGAGPRGRVHHHRTRRRHLGHHHARA